MHDLEFLFKTYYPALTVFAHKYTKDFDAAREIVQELFISMHEKQNSLSINQSPKSYLYQAVRNRSLNYIKKTQTEQSRKEDYFQTQSEQAYTFSDPIEASEFEARIHTLIKALPPACQQVFVLSRFEGKKNQEIADDLAISKRTVETQISKALKILREKIYTSKDSPSIKRMLMMMLMV